MPTAVLAHIVLFNTVANANVCCLFVAIGSSKECEHLSKGGNEKENEKVVFIG